MGRVASHEYANCISWHLGIVLPPSSLHGRVTCSCITTTHPVLAVDYLGKEESNLTVNFSRPGAQIVGQCECSSVDGFVPAEAARSLATLSHDSHAACHSKCQPT